MATTSTQTTASSQAVTSISTNAGNRKPRGARDSKPKIKVVVRRLPPNLTEEAFLTAVERWKDHYDNFYFVGGKPGRSSTRAYLNFKDPTQVFDFYEKFSIHAFVDSKGGEYRAIIEYAPYQKMPKGRRRQDLRRGSLDTDPDYLKFVEQLNAPKEVRLSAEQQLEKRLAEEAAKPTTFTTPLLEDLRLKKLAKHKMRTGESRSERWKRSKDNDKKKEKHKDDPNATGEKRNRERGRRREERRKKEDSESSTSSIPSMDKPIKILTRATPKNTATITPTPTSSTSSTPAAPAVSSASGGERKERRERRERKPKSESTTGGESRRGRGGATWMALKKNLDTTPMSTPPPSDIK